MSEKYSYLRFDLRCPKCGQPFENLDGHLRFMWGLLNQWYGVGDAIRWPAPLLEKFSSLTRRTIKRGQPKEGLVYAFDCDDDYSTWKCSSCGTIYDGPALVIRANVIEAVRLFRPGDDAREFGFSRGLADIVYEGAEGVWHRLDDDERAP